MSAILISGCSPIPLAHYLKALGVLRLIAESPEGDPNAQGAWKNDTFMLISRFDQKGLIDFFIHNYSPTPVMAPWNGGSGFFQKDSHEALEAITASTTNRLIAYKTSILAAARIIAAFKLKEKPDGETKARLLQSCRNQLPEAALAWLDAVVILGQEGPQYPPLLGTGGNDGRLEFTNNFMQRLGDLFDPATGKPTANSEKWLQSALWGQAIPGTTTKAPIGQFFPGAAGGANATSGFDGPSTVNPWDFVLMIEGALLFAAAAVKRLESQDDASLAYPFCVRQAGVGYASAALADENDARCEIWLPLWDRPVSLPELRAIFSEGRAQVGSRPAKNGVDFARAVTNFGVDRGIGSFQRYGFQVRNGLAYFATPLDRIKVQRNQHADLITDFEPWYERLRLKAGPKASQPAPAAVTRQLNQLERAILNLCRTDPKDGVNNCDALQKILLVLGQAERALAGSLKWSTENYLRPLAGLRSAWFKQADTNCPEFRLAASLAGMRAALGGSRGLFWFRQHLEPVEIGTSKDRSWANWAAQASNDVVWHDGHLTDALNDILARRLIRFEQAGAKGCPEVSPRPASLKDVTDFIEGRTNDALLADLIWGLSLVNWQSEELWPVAPVSPLEIVYDWKEHDFHQAVPSSFYALLKLCFQPPRREAVIPLDPTIFNRARFGQGEPAAQLAVRRLRASGKAPLVSELPVAGGIARRTAAALIFPIRPADLSLLEKIIIKQPEGVKA